MKPISQIAPVTDATAARLVRPDTYAALADDIVTGSGATSDIQAGRPARARSGAMPCAAAAARGAGALLIGVPLAAGLAVAGLIATSLGAPGQRIGPLTVGPASAQALSFTRHGHYIFVIVRNPVADPKRYRAEFAKYHLDITLRLVPASPSSWGAWSTRIGNGIVPITAVGKCFTGGGGNVCPVGVKVPVDFRGAATIVFARAARSGEQYESAGQANARGEVMHGLHYRGQDRRSCTGHAG